MNYLKLEVCKLLEEKGCASESGFYYSNADISYQYGDLELPFIESYDPMIITQCVLDERYSDKDELEISEIKKVSAFTWSDICTRSNAVKVWDGGLLCPECGGSEIAVEEYNFTTCSDCGQVAAEEEYIYELIWLLKMKLNGEDWESALLEHLRGKNE